MSSVDAAAKTTFLITQRPLASTQPPEQAPIPEPSAQQLSSWSDTLGRAMVVLQSATKDGQRGTELAVTAHQALETALGGAVAALNEQLRATQSGAAACGLLSNVMAAQAALVTPAGVQGKRAELANALADFKVRIAAAERCWLKHTRAWRYLAAFDALINELGPFGELASKVRARRENAYKQPCRAAYRDFIVAAPRTISDIEALLGQAEKPQPQGESD